MQVISGHLGWVRSIAFDPGNEWFCTGSADRTIKVNFVCPTIAYWYNLSSWHYLILFIFSLSVPLKQLLFLDIILFSFGGFLSVKLMFNCYLLWQWPTCHGQWYFVRPHFSLCYEPNFCFPSLCTLFSQLEVDNNFDARAWEHCCHIFCLVIHPIGQYCDSDNPHFGWVI